MRTAWIVASAALIVLAGAALARDERIELKSEDVTHVGPLNLASLNRTAQLAVTGVPGKTGFIPALDRIVRTAYEAKQPGTVELTLAFGRVQHLRQVRLLFGEGDYTWSLAAAESLPELEEQRGTFRKVVESRKTLSLEDTWAEDRLDPKQPLRALRLTVSPADPKRHVVLRELALTGEQSLQSIEVTSASSTLRFHDHHPLTVVGYFSGGDRVPITSKSLLWEIEPSAAARMMPHHRLWTRRPGPLQVRARFGKLASPPLSLEVE